MIARPTRHVTVGVNPTNIRAAVVANSPNSLPVTYAALLYSSGALELISESEGLNAAFATGTLTFGTNPTNTETLTVNGVVFTFVNTASTATNINIKGTKELTAVETAVVLNASANAAISVATYSVATNVLTITYDTAGQGGNAFTLADSSGGNVTRSGATLTGGTPVFGTNGQTVPQGVEFNDVDQSIFRYAICQTATVDLEVTDYMA